MAVQPAPWQPQALQLGAMILMLMGAPGLLAGEMVGAGPKDRSVALLAG